MPKKTEYAQGTPNWVDLQTTDRSAAKQFYSSLFGWSYDDRPMPDGGAVYAMATVNAEAVAAIAPMPPGAPEGRPPMWNTDLAADDVDAAVDKVAPAGGQVLMQPFDIGDAGRMAFVADPTAAPVALWQANQHIGATLVNEAGAVIWNELITDKPDWALPFYETVVGMTHSTMETAPGQNYTLLKAGESNVGGCMEPPMPGVPGPHWHVLLRGGRCRRRSGRGGRGGRADRRGAVRHSVGGAVRGSDRPAGRGVQRVEAFTTAVG